ncbi:MAG TPA: ABC transporter permease [Spongiibacteraceae bacterium]|nr:ABC transporter permease [Spongiibacteraceae bacterium]
MNARATLNRDGETLTLALSGRWCLNDNTPDLRQAVAQEVSTAAALAVDGAAIETWDSRLVAQLLGLQRWASRQQYALHFTRLPDGVDALLTLANAVPQPDHRSEPERRWSPAELWAALRYGWRESSQFIGELGYALGRAVGGRGDMRRQDFLHFFEQCGPGAIGIITLTSVLVGMILAYLGSVQLRQFGAELYVADLVAIGMVREMGALMTAVVMAGRTGAAYAAQLGTMQTREEIDVLKTIGLSPMEFLVLPRLLALVVAMPMLVLYANLLGMVGGGMVAISMDLSANQYLTETANAVSGVDFGAGLFKSVVFALLIAVAGCRAGLNCGRTSAAVGKATTDAVVAAVVYLIVADATINILYDKLGI